jgi:DNA-nicking Smr family endonuclease
MSGSRGRRLSESERILWREITRSIAPLRQQPADDPAGEEEIKPPVRPVPFRPAPAKPQAPAAKTSPPPLTPLSRRAKQRVARGQDTIDGRIDLHGLTQAEAHDALMRFLHMAQTRGARLVMVITGKGRGGEGGVLKRQVPLWLALPDFRAMVIGFEEAHQRHGGEGALYLRLRRIQPRE